MAQPSHLTITAPFASYGQIGPQTSGVWLVSQNGKGAIVDYAHLPTTGQWEYYWLGATQSQAMSRFYSAVGKLGIVSDQLPTSLNQAFSSGFQNLNFDQLQPFHIGAPSSTSSYAQGISQTGTAAQQAASNPLGSGAQIAAAIWQWLTTGSNWVRILEYIGGALLIYLGIRELTGMGGPA